MTATDKPQPSSGLWEAVHALNARELLNAIDGIDAAESYRVLQCLNACSLTLHGLVFRLARRTDRLVQDPAELPAAPVDDPAELVHAVATVLLMAERSLSAVQGSLHAACDDMSALFPNGTAR